MNCVQAALRADQGASAAALGYTEGKTEGRKNCGCAQGRAGGNRAFGVEFREQSFPPKVFKNNTYTINYTTLSNYS